MGDIDVWGKMVFRKYFFPIRFSKSRLLKYVCTCCHLYHFKHKHCIRTDAHTEL